MRGTQFVESHAVPAIGSAFTTSISAIRLSLMKDELPSRRAKMTPLLVCCITSKWISRGSPTCSPTTATYSCTENLAADMGAPQETEDAANADTDEVGEQGD